MRNKTVFRDIPIKRKLTIVLMVTVTGALVLSGALLVISDSILFRSYLQRDLAALSQIIADNSTAALAFDDPHTAGETLASLKARPHIVTACTYQADGTVLASYLRAGASPGCPPPATRAEVHFASSGITVSRPILLEGRRIGTFVLLYDLGEVYGRIRMYSATVLGVLLASSLIAFLLSSRLRALITNPISQLALAATSISRTSDYSIRATRSSGDELGVLVDAFNEMLARIQSRDNELKQALLAREEALVEARKARDFLQTTLASIGDAVISTDTEGRVVFANPVATSLVRWPGAEIAGKHLDEVFRIINEFSRETVESPVTKVLREGAVVGMANHTILQARDGTEIPISDSAAPIRDGDGAIQGTVLVFRDVTSRRRAEETRSLLAAIVESSVDAIIGLDLNGRFTSWNTGAERIFGYSMEEMIGRHTSDLSEPGSPDELPDILDRIAKGERIQQYQAGRRTKEGTVIQVSITISPLHDAVGRIAGASKIARDITQQVLAADRLAHVNADLQRTNEELARSNEDLQRFAFVASHDLQEPLRMITVYSQLLVKAFPGQVDDKAAMYIGYIVEGTKRMRDLLADLLAYSEIGARPEEPMAVVDLNVVLEKVLQNLKVAIDDSGAEITHSRLPSLRAYEGHFIPLLQNLIGNAIKYRCDQTPRVDISMREQEDQMRFEVADNGTGIEPQYRAKIFVAFKRLHGKDIPGTGIGLAICQRVVELYGGRIWVESEPGRGSSFIFTLPSSIKPDRGVP